ncbi:MAG TPA: hypothetical protein PKV72_00635, partial [Candidatus Peribacteria bacterium]|nr:hypothetical protein [Candidatus Peribacteria bacterium]
MIPDVLSPAEFADAAETLRQLSHRSVLAEPLVASLQAFLERVRAIVHPESTPAAEAVDASEIERQRYLDTIWEYARASLQYARGGRRWTHILDPRLRRSERESEADPFVGIRAHPPSFVLGPCECQGHR